MTLWALEIGQCCYEISEKDHNQTVFEGYRGILNYKIFHSKLRVFRANLFKNHACYRRNIKFYVFFEKKH